MKDKRKKILVTVDGSKRSLETIRFITKNDIFNNMKIVLFHVFAGVPESYFDIERERMSIKTISSVKAWEIQQKKVIKQHMELLSIKLTKAGFSEDNVVVKIQKMKKGIARDIINESRNGYVAVVSRRRGISAIRGVVLGSVATKLVEKLTFMPLVLVGKKPAGNKILLGFDGSEGAMRAVNFAGTIFSGYNYKVCLVNVMRGAGKLSFDNEGERLEKELLQKAKKNIMHKLSEARKVLVNSGFDDKNLSSKIISGVFSRANTLSKIAKQENFGTLVLGRRGLTKTRDFFIGRVTNKTIHIAREKTVWIIR